jgi:hypothetical protein
MRLSFVFGLFSRENKKPVFSHMIDIDAFGPGHHSESGGSFQVQDSAPLYLHTHTGFLNPFLW